MSDGRLGFWGAVSIGLGGMIGGGVFSVLGVVAVVAGTASWLAFTQRDHEAVNPVVPAVGVVGVLTFAPLLLARLYTEQQAVFWSVLALSTAVVAAELLYFERERIADEAEAFEVDVEGALFD